MSRSAGHSRRFPWLNLPFLVVIVLLVGYGLTIVYSAVRVDADYQYSRQIGGVAVGVICMILMWRFDYRRLSEYTTLFLIVNVVLILSPHIPGLGTDAGMGAKSWIKLGMQIQPGEFAKITVILMDAAVMARYGGRLDDPREYLKALGIMLVPFACIMTQPDLGTGLVYLCIAAFALVMGGARPKYLLITLAVGIAAIAAVFAIDEVFKSSTGEYKLLKQYQRNRLLVFMDQSGTATTDEGYNLRQAQVAIGSGGVFGKGPVPGHAKHSLGLSARGAHRLHLLRAGRRAAGFFGVAGAAGARTQALVLLCFRISVMRSPATCSASVIVDVRGGDVAVPDSGEHRHGLRAYAHHGHPAAVHELRLVVHGGEFLHARHDRVGVDAQLRA